MVTMSEWHVSTELWQAYASGRLGDVATGSIDAHVAECAECQRSARAVVPGTTTAAAWAGILSEVRRPELPPTVRWLRRLGVPEKDLVVLAASEGFVLPWSLAVCAALVCAMLTALIPARQDQIFWLLAPTAPVFAVIAAFAATEQLRAITSATPYDKVRLALLRTAATLGVAIPATLAVGLSIPGLADLAFVWLLPALALTSFALVLNTWLSSWTAAGLTTGGWLGVVMAVAHAGEFAALSAVGVQVACLAVVVAMAAVFVLRSSSFRLLGGEG
jgi:hypothetical protein